MEITSERLLLREFVAQDWAAVLGYQVKPEYLRYYAWTGRAEAEVRDFVARFVEDSRQEPRLKYQLAIELDGRLIGNCGIRKEHEDATEADIGYELDPAYWGKGYATEAGRALVDFGFLRLGLHRLWSYCVADNQASARVLERLGLQLEGRLREKEWIKGRWRDTLVFGLLKREWEAAASSG